MFLDFGQFGDMPKRFGHQFGKQFGQSRKNSGKHSGRHVCRHVCKTVRAAIGGGFCGSLLGISRAIRGQAKWLPHRMGGPGLATILSRTPAGFWFPCLQHFRALTSSRWPLTDYNLSEFHYKPHMCLLSPGSQGAVLAICHEQISHM